MPSTSVHLPEDLLRELDRTARRRPVSRNRLIVEACRSLLGQGKQEWPENFFAPDRLSRRDRDLLRSSFADFLQHLRSARRSKSHAPF